MELGEEICDWDVVKRGLISRHISNVKFTLSLDVVEIKAGAFKGELEFILGLLGQVRCVKPDSDRVLIVRVGRLRAEFKRETGGERCEQGLGRWAEM